MAGRQAGWQTHAGAAGQPVHTTRTGTATASRFEQPLNVMGFYKIKGKEGGEVAYKQEGGVDHSGGSMGVLEQVGSSVAAVAALPALS